MFNLMNKLPLETRAQILNLLVEGSSLRSISRLVDVSINTVTKLLVDAGTVAAAYHDQNVRGLQTRRLQCDEIWSFSATPSKRTLRRLRPHPNWPAMFGLGPRSTPKAK
jgi:hypothetical protein